MDAILIIFFLKISLVMWFISQLQMYVFTAIRQIETSIQVLDIAKQVIPYIWQPF